MRKKYNLEIDVQSFGSTGLQGHRFLNWDLLVASGDNLAELLDNCSISTQDQDGGEGPEYSFDDLSGHMQVAVQRLIMQKTQPKRHDTEWNVQYDSENGYHLMRIKNGLPQYRIDFETENEAELAAEMLNKEQK